MTIRGVVFPFDLFGSSGTAAGARLLGDLLREIVDDTQRETKATRQKALEAITVDEVEFDDLASLAKWETLGATAAKAALKASDFTLWLGGNHLSVKPLFDALDPGTLVVQLDAHLDCYDLHDTHSTLSHGNFLREVRNPIVTLGHRDLFLKPKAIAKTFLDAHSAEDLAIDEVAVLASLKKRVSTAKDVWLDIDADAFDPSVCPAVQQPLPFGLTGHQALRIVHAIGFDKLRGVSLSEFDPGRDAQDRGLEFLGWLIEWLLLKNAEA